MAAPRASQFIGLKNLARGTQQARHLHMTSPATYASPLLTQARPVLNLPRDIASLRAECKRRKIDASGSTQDLTSRLNADELAHSRAFSNITSPSRRPSTSHPSSAPSTRPFTSSRNLKAVGDNSTIDFAYLPSADVDPLEDDPLIVPILPNNFTTKTNSISDDDGVVMKPEISTMSADAVFLPMSDMSDGHAMNIDFHAMADRVAANFKRMKVPVEEQASMMKQIWSDMVDDMLKASKKPAV